MGHVRVIFNRPQIGTGKIIAFLSQSENTLEAAQCLLYATNVCPHQQSRSAFLLFAPFWNWGVGTCIFHSRIDESAAPRVIFLSLPTSDEVLTGHYMDSSDGIAVSSPVRHFCLHLYIGIAELTLDLSGKVAYGSRVIRRREKCPHL